MQTPEKDHLAATDRVYQIDAIKPIYESRLFEERGQMNSNVLSYRRSMSVSHHLPSVEP